MRKGRVIVSTGSQPHSLDVITQNGCVIVAQTDLTQVKARQVVMTLKEMCDDVSYEGDDFALRLLGVK